VIVRSEIEVELLLNDRSVCKPVEIANDGVVVFVADKATLFSLPMIFEHMINDTVGESQPRTDRWKIKIARVARPVPTVPRPWLPVTVDDLDPGRSQLVVQRFQVFADHRHRTA
jgi:hypothetical protein